MLNGKETCDIIDKLPDIIMINEIPIEIFMHKLSVQEIYNIIDKCPKMINRMSLDDPIREQVWKYFYENHLANKGFIIIGNRKTYSTLTGENIGAIISLDEFIKLIKDPHVGEIKYSE